MVTLNIKKILKEQGKSKYWLFNEMNNIGSISYSNFNAMVEQKTKSIKYDNIDKLCKILNCNISDLLTRDTTDTKKMS